MQDVRDMLPIKLLSENGDVSTEELKFVAIQLGTVT